MPQFHIKRPGSRGYLDYHTNDMVLSRESVQKGMTWREVAKEIDVSQSTLTHQIRSGETNNLGQPSVLSMIEENVIERTQSMHESGLSFFHEFSDSWGGTMVGAKWRNSENLTCSDRWKLLSQTPSTIYF